MPPPPPPPGPPLPPPPPIGPLGGGARGGASNDKGQLLADIRKGTGLKKVVTNDRSAPIIDGKKQNGSSDVTRSNGAPQGLGGLFAGGMPKLKSAVPGRPGVQPLKPPNKMGNDTAEGKSNTPGPQPKFTKHSEVPAGYGTMRRPFPTDGKPLAPLPPPIGQVFNKSSVPDVTNNNVNRPKPSPQLPIKPQAFNAPRIQIQQGTRSGVGGNPGSKPPPPPKSPGTNVNMPPALPSKPPSLQRHQSMNENDLRNRRSFGPGGTPGMLGSRNSQTGTVSPAASMNAIPTAVNNAMDNNNRMGGPPPYGQHMRNGSSPHLSMHGKQSHAPPPPPNRNTTSAPRPPPPPPPSRVGTQQSQPPPPPPHRTGPPPPPPGQQFKQVALGGQTGHVTGQALPPPPPARNFSARNSACGGDDFESRFAHLFRSENEFPQPGPFIGHKKFYPSENAKNGQGQRNPPPPPPTSIKNDNTQYQIGQKMFSREATKC